MVSCLREVTFKEYLEFVSKNKIIRIEDQEISLEPIKVRSLIPSSSELTDISTTVWSFPQRGSWATHRGDYRGNWAPQIPRALISMYTTKGETILDPMIGSGTTCIEARLLGRNCIAVDINYEALMLTMHRIYWLEEAIKKHVESKLEPYSIGDVSIEEVLQTSVRVYHGDARRLEFLSDNSVDAVFTHPPYWNIIEYQGICHPGDLSCTKKLEEYLDLMRDIAREIYRVLKPGKYAAILVGDTRVRKHYVPISHHVLRVFLEAGFVLKEEVIKVQHKMKTTREIWRRIKNRDFLLIAHEKLFILRKPLGDEELSEYKYSTSLLYRV